ncbi:SGNH/GDSL hydrolase family protein [Massilia endophytica]|uniref:SGNH/GDSL hydrolase family protein n=1 Tax=Massilia endophytica TaxID=2899220 RepID=UPI001E388641|nr:SGNH/GDSL hydrolase family protein [Massilia endophytica]UGQ45810.1 esterase [Massilia endophytica]
MRYTKLALAAMTAAVLAACGGGSGAPKAGDNSQQRVKFASQVSFGDSLSDVGTYAVGTVKALNGGKWTINGNNTSINPDLTGKNWTELMAAQFGLPAPCPAVTGLDGDATKGFSVPVTTNASCFGYAQGGARVSNPVGSGHKATGSAFGALTYPVSKQIDNHLAKVGGKFKGDEVVFMMAGANDILGLLGSLQLNATAAGTAAGKQAFATSLATQLAAGATNPATAAQAIGLAMATEAAKPGSTDQTVVTAGVTAAVMAGNTAAGSPAVYGPMVAKAQADAATAGAKAGADYAAAQGPAQVAAMGALGTELANMVKTKLIGNGANYVVVMNIPDVATTPSAASKDANTRGLIDNMAKAFNAALATGLASETKALLVDVYTVSHDQIVNPGPYGLTNVTDTACDLTPAKNPLGQSVVCTASNLKAGDVSHYSFADDLHPTPFNYLLLARYVSKAMVTRGWL